jgi:hypothetical protein
MRGLRAPPHGVETGDELRCLRQARELDHASANVLFLAV